MSEPHMVEQVIKYSDGTETVVSYRGVIVDGVLTPNTEEKPAEAKEEVSEVPAEEKEEVQAD